MKKILVIRYGTIGDTIFASPFYRELRNAMPHARIDVLVDKIAAEVMKNCPYIDNMYYVKGKYKNILSYISMLRKYDTIYFPKSDSFFTLTAFLAGIKNRIGFNIPRNKFLTKKSPYNMKRHEVDCYLDLLRITDIPVNSDKTELWLNKDSNIKAQKLTEAVLNKKIMIHAFSRFSQKNWPNEYWVKVVNYMSNELKAQVFFVGSEEDTDKYKNITDKLDTELMPLNMCGKLSIADTMSLVNNMDIVIGIDSGVIHMAAALNKPSILLHGPTSLVRWLPRSEACTVLSGKFSCSPCCLQKNSKKYCKNKVSECMKYLTPDMVIKAVCEKLNNRLKTAASL